MTYMTVYLSRDQHLREQIIVKRRHSRSRPLYCVLFFNSGNEHQLKNENNTASRSSSAFFVFSSLVPGCFRAVQERYHGAISAASKLFGVVGRAWRETRVPNDRLRGRRSGPHTPRKGSYLELVFLPQSSRRPGRGKTPRDRIGSTYSPGRPALVSYNS